MDRGRGMIRRLYGRGGGDLEFLLGKDEARQGGEQEALQSKAPEEEAVGDPEANEASVGEGQPRVVNNLS